jgi:lipopolysaccharide/colanic/teichoic acid biosynthesis glycosyltransferase
MTPQLLIDLNKKLEQHLFRSRLHDGLHSPSGVQRALLRERARTERSGDVFCCALFRLDRGTRENLQDLAGLIARRVRLTDEVGWFDPDTVCAILPQTDEPGAHCFAADVVAQASQQIDSTPRVTVYVYPAGPTGPGGSSDKRLSPIGLQSPLAEAHLLGLPEPRIQEGTDAAAFETISMDRLFVRPLPWWKRGVDAAGAGFGLLVTSPILLAAALAVKLSSPGPVIFAQRRAGIGGRWFNIYKFRSMYVDAEARKAELQHLNEQDGPAFKIKNDPRVTRVGRFLRSTSIDELPQLFNVLRGDMSFVGPRPPTLDEVAKYSTWYRRRLEVTPGITCIWQVSARSQVSFEEWMRMDIRYIRQFGLWQDIKLLMGTLPSVLLRRGAC